MLEEIIRYFRQGLDITCRKMRHSANDLGRCEILFWFTGGIYLGDDDLISILESPCKIEKEDFCAGIGVRLPDGPDAAFWITCARTSQRGLDFSRMVGIIIKYTDPIHLTAQLEAAVCSSKHTQSFRSLLAWKAEHVHDRQNSQCIADIMLTRHLQRDIKGIGPFADQIGGSREIKAATHI